MSTFFIGVPTEVHIPGLMQADQRSLNPAIPLMSIDVIQHQIRLRLQFSQHATSLMGIRIAVGGLTTLCDAVIFVQWQVITKKVPLTKSTETLQRNIFHWLMLAIPYGIRGSTPMRLVPRGRIGLYLFITVKGDNIIECLDFPVTLILLPIAALLQYTAMVER